MSVSSYFDATMLKWIPPKSKQIEVYSTNVSSLTINPKLGYRHKLLTVAINGLGQGSTTLTREAVDITLGAKTVVRYPAWLWGQSPSIQQVGSVAASVSLNEFLLGWAQRGILDLLPDAAEDEVMTLTMISGTSYPVIDVKYLEYPSDQSLAHDVPGGSDYWRKYFIAWFYLLATQTGNGQQLTESGEPPGLSLLGLNGRLPPNKAFHQFSIISGYQNANENSSITNYSVYNALHEWKNDEELFTPDTHAGLYCNQQSSGGAIDTGSDMFQCTRRVVDFNPNDSLQLYADVTSITGSGSPIWVTIDGILEDLSKKPAGAGGAPA